LSAYLEAGVHEDVRVQLDDPLQNDDTVFAMAHRDTNGNEAYDFPAVTAARTVRTSTRVTRS